MENEFVDKLKRKLEPTDFYRIFIQNNETKRLFVKDGKIEDVNESESFGLNIFYVKDNFSYFYATNDLHKLDSFELVNSDKLPKNINYNVTESFIKDKKVIGEKSDIDIELIANDFSTVTKTNDKITTNLGNLRSSIDKRTIICRDTEIEQTYNRNFASFYAIAKENNKIRDDNIRLGYNESLKNKLSEFINNNESMRQDLIKKISYKEGLSGTYDIIIDPDLSDLLAHEAIGHATESDLVYNGFSVLKNKLGVSLASNFVNLLDDPTPRNGHFGSFYYDDEGFPAECKYLIKEGKLNDYIMSCKYASLLNRHNNGGARCESYSVLPIPRMSNTSFESGELNINEMISDTKSGVLLSRGSGGQVDPNSGVFQFGVREGQIIKNGELKDEYLNLTFGGNILDSLKNIVGISKEIENNQPGFCGKDDQSVPVGGFGPYLKMRNIKLG